jgi:hypothetical protein
MMPTARQLPAHAASPYERERRGRKAASHVDAVMPAARQSPTAVANACRAEPRSQPHRRDDDDAAPPGHRRYDGALATACVLGGNDQAAGPKPG